MLFMRVPDFSYMLLYVVGGYKLLVRVENPTMISFQLDVNPRNRSSPCLHSVPMRYILT